jgi:c-di-GMP-binding flagellar brake protein YcgR
MDRRNKSRIDAQLTCYVRTGRLTATPVRTMTENVSRTGILMRWMSGVSLPKIGGKLVLDLQLPESSEFGSRVMRCRAQVLRITPGSGTDQAVALRILSIRFVISAPPSAKKIPSRADLASMPVATGLVC